MKYFLIKLALVSSFLFLSACSEPGSTDDSEAAVGFVRLDYEDPSRRNWSDTAARPLVTYVWYPAKSGSKMRTIRVPPDRPIFIGGDAAPEAEFAEGDNRFPLIVMSHGTGGAGMQMMWLGRELAEQGFIAVAVDHHGNTAAEDTYDPRGFRLPWERALDLTVVTDLILDDPKFGPRINASRIGAVGYSLGGYTVVALAGGITDLAKFSEFCEGAERDATCDPQPEYPEADEDFRRLVSEDAAVSESLARQSDSFRDERISSFVALAPALIQAFSQESLQAIEAPFLVVSGTNDRIAPAATNSDRLLSLIPNVHYVEADGADHYVFLNACTLKGRMFVSICRDPAGVSRGDSHADISEAVAVYFRNTLGDE
jgi:predicted dienelactone hydrolase